MDLITADNAFFVGVGAFCAAAAIVVVAGIAMWVWVSRKENNTSERRKPSFLAGLSRASKGKKII